MKDNMTNNQHNIVDNYFASILTRFFNMKQHHIDELGLQRAIEMAERYQDTGTITPGEFEYIYNRTHAKGKLPKYNKTGKKYGLMDQCPVDIMVEHVVDWTIPAHQFKHQLSTNHPEFYQWYSNSNNLNRPKLSPVYKNLFKEG